MKYLCIVMFAILAAGCPHESYFSEGMILGQEEIDAETLNQGRTAYTFYCRPCHGDNGDGLGPASYTYWPPPRDFGKASFKFAGVPEGVLPTDEALMHIVQEGLNGTAMLPWDISYEEAWLAIQYLKTFSPCDKCAASEQECDKGDKQCARKACRMARVCEKGKGYRHPRKKPVEAQVPEDPFAVIPRLAMWDDAVFDEWVEAQRAGGAQIPTDVKGVEGWKKDKLAEAVAKRDEAIAVGEKQYHEGGCQLCHSSYLHGDKIVAMGGNPRAVYPFDPDPKFSKTYEVVLVPPDFTRHRVRSPQRYWDADGVLHYDARDFYKVIAAGIPGTAMPSWAALPPDKVWAVSYYTAHLSELRGTDQARKMRDELLAMPEWKPPPPPPAEPAPDPSGQGPEAAKAPADPPAKPEAAKAPADPPAKAPAKAEPAKAPAKAEPAKAEPAKAEPAKAEPAKAEPAKAPATAAP